MCLSSEGENDMIKCYAWHILLFVVKLLSNYVTQFDQKQSIPVYLIDRITGSCRTSLRKKYITRTKLWRHHRWNGITLSYIKVLGYIERKRIENISLSSLDYWRDQGRHSIDFVIWRGPTKTNTVQHFISLVCRRYYIKIQKKAMFSLFFLRTCN